MRVEERVFQHDTNIGDDSERVGMTIDDSALAHIMSVLTDLYSDPELAVLREYSTNALDSHVEAGQSQPIAVTLPSSLSPFLKVRDYGTGLDAEGIREVYSRYGTSTKRDSNDAVGMLGLGCKSALTYADQFTLVGVKEGRAVTVLVSRDADGAGSMTIVDDSETDQPNGVEVVIPAKRGHDFAAKAADFFRFWAQGTVLVNGEKPKRVGGLWVSDNLLLTNEVEADTIVQGNVPYPMQGDTSRGWRQPKLVAFVPIGSVTFTPSREALQGTKRVLETCAQLRAEARACLDAAVAKQVNDAPTAAEAQRVLREGMQAGFKGAPTWQGQQVMLTIDRAPTKPAGAANFWHAPEAGDMPDQSLLTIGTAYGRRKGERVWHVPADQQLHWFEGYESRGMTPTKRKKLEVWASRKGLTLGQVVFCQQLTAAEKVWLPAAHLHAWAEVDAIKIDRAARADNINGRPRGSYDALVDGTAWTLQADDIDTSAPLYWCHGNYSHASALGANVVKAGATIVPLPGNRLDRFRRDFPTALELGAAVRAALVAKVAALPAAELEAWRVQRGSDLSSLSCLDPDQLTDPKLQALVKQARVKTDNAAALYQECRHLLHDSDLLTGKRATYHDDTYPLLQAARHSRAGTKAAEHATMYANAVHAAALAAEGLAT